MLLAAALESTQKCWREWEGRTFRSCWAVDVVDVGSSSSWSEGWEWRDSSSDQRPCAVSDSDGSTSMSSSCVERGDCVDDRRPDELGPPISK